MHYSTCSSTRFFKYSIDKHVRQVCSHHEHSRLVNMPFFCYSTVNLLSNFACLDTKCFTFFNQKRFYINILSFEFVNSSVKHLKIECKQKQHFVKVTSVFLKDNENWIDMTGLTVNIIKYSNKSLRQIQ